MRTNTLWKIAAVLVILGFVLFVVNYLVYVPWLTAFAEALTKSRITNTVPPDPQTFGLDNTSFIVSAALSTFSLSLIFVGVSILVIFIAVGLPRS